MVLLPLLAAMAAAVGTTRRLRLTPGRRGWFVYPILWTAVVAKSGSKKSPALDTALEPLRRIDDRLEEASKHEQEAYDRNRAIYEADLAEWKKTGRRKGLPPPTKPEVPGHRCAIVSDVTVEAMARVLETNPRGVLVARDELGAWVGGFDAYHAAAKDAQNWLELHRAGRLKIDRKGSKPIRVMRAAANVTGTIQPDVLKRIMAGHVEDGLLARFVLASPPRRLNRWSEAHVSDAAAVRLDAVFEGLAAVDFLDEDHTPGTLELDQDAKRAWIEWYDDHGSRQADTEGALTYAFAKIQELPARLASIFALADNPGTRTVTAEPMRAAIALGRWFADEAERIYAIWDEKPEDRHVREAADWVAGRGEATVRELYSSGPRRYRGKQDDAEKILARAVKIGLLVREARPPGPAGGPPTLVFRTPNHGSGSTTPKNMGETEVSLPLPRLDVRESTPREPDPESTVPLDEEVAAWDL